MKATSNVIFCRPSRTGRWRKYSCHPRETRGIQSNRPWRSKRPQECLQTPRAESKLPGLRQFFAGWRRNRRWNYDCRNEKEEVRSPLKSHLICTPANLSKDKCVLAPCINAKITSFKGKIRFDDRHHFFFFCTTVIASSSAWNHLSRSQCGLESAPLVGRLFWEPSSAP